MTYLPSLGASDAAPSFNTTKYPGICKPENQQTLDMVFELQRQLNRVAQVRGLKKISIDGDIGPGTVGLFNSVLGTSAACDTIGSQIATFTAQVRVLATSLGAPAKVSSPAPAKTPSFVLPSGLEVAAPKGIAASASDSLGLPVPVIAALGLGAIVIGYKMTKKKGRR